MCTHPLLAFSGYGVTRSFFENIEPSDDQRMRTLDVAQAWHYILPPPSPFAHLRSWTDKMWEAACTHPATGWVAKGPQRCSLVYQPIIKASQLLSLFLSDSDNPQPTLLSQYPINSLKQNPRANMQLTSALTLPALALGVTASGILPRCCGWKRWSAWQIARRQRGMLCACRRVARCQVAPPAAPRKRCTGRTYIMGCDAGLCCALL